jgi:hypothetical protein
MFRFIRLWRDLSAFGVVEWFAVKISMSRRVISFRSGSCLSKLDRVKANSFEIIKFNLMKSYKENLDNYLETEKILNEFFNEFNFCITHCIPKEIKKDRRLPSIGCCNDKYYKKHDLKHPDFELLCKERVKLYGKPEDKKNPQRVSPCEYHTPQGCELKSHKSPTCLSFLCKEGIECLRERHQVFEYDYLGIYYALEWILTGDMSGKALDEFKTDCLNMVEKIKRNGTL